MAEYFNPPALKSAIEFIGEGRHLYIPPYQRPFAWDKEKISRFFDDVREDMVRRMIGEEGDGPDTETVSFIGTLVCFDDRDHKTVHPSVQNMVPPGVHTVVDGQQRLTVLMITAIVLHNYMHIRLRSVGDEGWLQKQCTVMMADLLRMIEADQKVGDHPYYPRMIRAFDDQWSTNADESLYVSPVSYYLSRYGNFIRSSGGGRFSFDGKDSGDARLTSTQRASRNDFIKSAKEICSIVKKICSGDADESSGYSGSFPDIKRIFDHENKVGAEVLKVLFNISLDSPPNLEDEKRREIVRALLLASYLMRRVHFVSLVTKDENYAFDIFDSLNTTGEPLTAYQTFKPSVMRAEGVAEFKSSDSECHTKAIDEYLASCGKEAESVTAEMLISFALAESGQKLSKKLHVQRDYLVRIYDKDLDGDMDERRLFTRHLMHVSEVYRYLWGAGTSVLELGKLFNCSDDDSLMKKELPQARFCLDFLISAKHTIALAPIARFYESARLSPGDIGKVKDLCAIIKAFAAFFALWRSSRETTEGIDNVYRSAMSGSHVWADKNIAQLPALCRTSRNTVSAGDVRKYFRQVLKKHGGNSGKTIISREKWEEYVQNVPIYRTTAPVAKFLLILAAHDSEPDNEQTGLLRTVREGVRSSLINEGVWGDDSYETVEHINPQNLADDVHPDKLHRLGNLTLLPRGANSIIGDRPWRQKILIYRMLSAGTETELREAKNDVLEFLPEESIAKLCKVRYLPMTKAVAMCDKFDYDADVNGRESNLLEMAWRFLSEWLDFDAD